MNTFDFVVCAVCILTGVRMLLDGAAAPLSIQALPAVLTMLFKGVLILAGVFILAGLTCHSSVRWGSAAERAGMWLAGTGYMTYAAALIASGANANATLITLTILAVGLGCGVRARGIGFESKALLQALQETPRGDA